MGAVRYNVSGYSDHSVRFIHGLRENHIKRRLAYSTVSNLSYMLFSLMIMTPEGMVGGLAHMLFHSVLKITLFFVAGAIIYKTGREYVDQFEGFGKSMPLTMAAFTICSMGIIGIPPLMGITSKWLISKAAVDCGDPLAIVGYRGSYRLCGSYHSLSV